MFNSFSFLALDNAFMNLLDSAPNISLLSLRDREEVLFEILVGTASGNIYSEWKNAKTRLKMSEEQTEHATPTVAQTYLISIYQPFATPTRNGNHERQQDNNGEGSYGPQLEGASLSSALPRIQIDPQPPAEFSENPAAVSASPQSQTFTTALAQSTANTVPQPQPQSRKKIPL